MAYTNSCLNPILYPLVSENFRKGFCHIIGLCLNRLSCGRLCGNYQNFRFNSRSEVTFCNSNKSRNSTKNRSSSSQQKSLTNTTTNNTITIVGQYSVNILIIICWVVNYFLRFLHISNVKNKNLS